MRERARRYPPPRRAAAGNGETGILVGGGRQFVDIVDTAAIARISQQRARA
jgi:hypothetical protein